MTDQSDLDRAFDRLLDTIQQATKRVRSHPSFADPANHPSAYQFIARMLLARIEAHLVFDPAQPYFRVLDHRVREGGDNADQRYLMATLQGGATYRVHGTVGSARRVDFQVYAGLPTTGAGRMAGFLDFEDLGLGVDDSFEVTLSVERPDGVSNWVACPAEATELLVRQIYSDWTADPRGTVHIDRVGAEGDFTAPLRAEQLTQRLDAAAAELIERTTIWPALVQGYVERTGWNALSAPFDPGALGGVPGRWMCHGTFNLAADEALVIRTWPAAGNYQGIQLTDMWFSSLEYANRQGSLTADQSELSADGSYWSVVSATDPGIRNWLDTGGLPRGAILLRFDGTRGTPIEADQHPTAIKVRLDDLGAVLPDGVKNVSPEERRRIIASRRRHIQARYDC